ncbi:antigen 5 like allergen Cul n 1-like [Episyrphus balteatus]|uniref:antigen 5 like allergen Cul n 1-like n=1 Tax=Episyrphus balteatus TaxID=286459 RepID=UPI002486300F|nr:antigen 5 like allergen Cul n 1-like [Episyrphus balteatus]
MKSFELLLVLIGFVGLVAISQAATNYCAKELCGSAAKHIACNATGQFADTCSSDRKLITMTPEITAAILNRMNLLRNRLASGNMTKFQPCPRMATMSWNAELSKLAELNVKTCKYGHDACHNTLTSPQSGQNIGMLLSDAPLTATPLNMIIQIINAWWAESKDTTMTEINKYPESPKAVIGHFTEMVIQANYLAGCSAGSFILNKQYAFLFVCNFHKINIINGAIYVPGKSASKCSTGPNPRYKGLCSNKEKYQ